MESLRGEPALSSKTTNGIFFYCGKSLVVISSVHRMLTSITSIVWQIGEKVEGEKKPILVQHGKGFLGIMLRPILEGLAELV